MSEGIAGSAVAPMHHSQPAARANPCIPGSLQTPDQRANGVPHAGLWRDVDFRLVTLVDQHHPRPERQPAFLPHGLALFPTYWSRGWGKRGRSAFVRLFRLGRASGQIGPVPFFARLVPDRRPSLPVGRRELFEVVVDRAVDEIVRVAPGGSRAGRSNPFEASFQACAACRKLRNSSSSILRTQLRLKAVKNKVGTPLRETTINLYYPDTNYPCGLDTVGDLITYASNIGLFEMSGSWYNMDLGRLGEDKKPLGVERLANGLANLKELLRNDSKALEIIRKKVSKLADAENEVKV